MYETLKLAIETPSFLQSGRVLGFWLQNSYTHTIPQKNNLPASLKGVDMAVFEMVRILGLQCCVKPVVTLDPYRVDADWPEVDDNGEVHLLRDFSAFEDISSFR